MQTKLPETIAEFLQRTGNLLIHLHDHCNLACRHCYLAASPQASHRLPFDLVIRTLDEAHHLGIQSIQFSGGEPLLYPRMEDLLCHCVGKSFQTTLSTNGTLLTADHLSLLKRLEATVVTSVDGAPDYHDGFRGQQGAFRRTEASVDRMVAAGVRVKIVATICRDNFNAVGWLAGWAAEKGVAAFQVQPLEKVGRATQIAGARLSHENLCDLFIRLNDLAVHYAASHLKITMTYKSRARMLEHPCLAYVCNGQNCHRKVEKELKKIVIREDGDILPELVDIDRRFKIGNLRNATLEQNLQSYLSKGYAQFDAFCRNVFEVVLRDYPSPLVPWNEMLAEQSYRWPSVPTIAEALPELADASGPPSVSQYAH